MVQFTFHIEYANVLEDSGFRFGDKGTHTSRTMMLSELEDLLQEVPATASRADYANAIIENNVLGKQTAATRRLSNQRIGELYGLDRRLPLFRVLLHLWEVDPDGHPLISLIMALARDPLLRSTAPAIINLPVGAELVRTVFLDALREDFRRVYDEAKNGKGATSLERHYSMPNIARRFVESFLAFRYPDCPGDLAKRLERVEYDSCKKTRILRLLNTYSHAGMIADPEHDPSVLAETEAVLGELLDMIKSADPTHYECMEKLVCPLEESDV